MTDYNNNDLFNDELDDLINNNISLPKGPDLNQNMKKQKNQQQNRISSIFDKNINKEDLEDNKVKIQEEIVKSKKSEKINKLRLISENDIKIYLKE